MTVELLHAIEELENTLKCGICSSFFENPVVIGSCGHTFCRKCVSQHIGKECPSCTIPVSERDTLEDKQLKGLLPLVRRLKSLAENTSSNKENVVLEANKVASSDDKPSATSVPKLSRCTTRTPKPVACRDPDCCNGSASKHHHPGKAMKTPTNKMAHTPGVKSGKKTPYSFYSLSSKKKLASKSNDSKLFSPSNIEKKNLKGETLLQTSVIKGDIEKVKELLKMKANPNVKDNAGWSPLHEASNHGFLDIARLLVDHGAEIDAIGQDEITPLHDAIMNGHMEVAYYLASKGADIYSKTSLGNTALDLCTTAADKKSLLSSFEIFTKTFCTPESKESPVVNSDEKLLLLCTSLDEAQKEKFLQCVQLLMADSTEEFTPEVTHIVTSTDKNGQCSRTLKILQGILNGTWIVNMQWVEMCLEYKKRVSEEVFEIPGTKQMPDTFGPKRARETIANQNPPLFDGCSFYIYGQINPPAPSKEDLCQLIQLGGGKILVREPRPETADVEHSTPFHARSSSLSDVSHFILYQDKPPRNAQMRDKHINTVTVRWLIECICAYKLLDPDK